MAADFTLLQDPRVRAQLSDLLAQKIPDPDQATIDHIFGGGVVNVGNLFQRHAKVPGQPFTRHIGPVAGGNITALRPNEPFDFSQLPEGFFGGGGAGAGAGEQPGTGTGAGEGAGEDAGTGTNGTGATSGPTQTGSNPAPAPTTPVPEPTTPVPTTQTPVPTTPPPVPTTPGSNVSEPGLSPLESVIVDTAINQTTQPQPGGDVTPPGSPVSTAPVNPPPAPTTEPVQGGGNPPPPPPPAVVVTLPPQAPLTDPITGHPAIGGGTVPGGSTSGGVNPPLFNPSPRDDLFNQAGTSPGSFDPGTGGVAPTNPGSDFATVSPLPTNSEINNAVQQGTQNAVAAGQQAAINAALLQNFFSNVSSINDIPVMKPAFFGGSQAQWAQIRDSWKNRGTVAGRGSTNLS